MPSWPRRRSCRAHSPPLSKVAERLARLGRAANLATIWSMVGSACLLASRPPRVIRVWRSCRVSKGVTLPAKVHQIGFPMAEFGTAAGLGRTPVDRRAVGDRRFAPADARPPAATWLGAGQVAVQALAPPDRAVDPAVDGLMADPVGCVSLQSARDLLGRPPHRKPVADQLAELAAALELGATQASGPGKAVRGLGQVAAIGPPIAAELPIDRRSMPAEPISDHTDHCSGCMQPEQRMTLLERQLIVASPHRDPILSGWCRASNVNLRGSISGTFDPVNQGRGALSASLEGPRSAAA